MGKHNIHVEVADGCGNIDECDFKLTVKDCKAPTPYCYSEITTVVMPSSKMIDIWASDFDRGSFDNCPGNLTFSFSADTTDKQAIFDCDRLGFQVLEMWVTDASGNQDFCKVKVDIQDNNGVCGGQTRISGTVQSYDDKVMSNVELSLKDLQANIHKDAITDVDGKFNFYGISSGTDYKVSADKNNDFMNGVSTLDLVLIQRHILGISQLDSPFKLIAADVNNNQKITTSDLVALRKLILGIDSKYKDNTSWIFVDGNQEIDDPSSPWNHPEEIIVKGQDIGSGQLSFLGIKVGDVNNSVKINLRSNTAEPRTIKPLKLSINDAQYEGGDVVKIDFKTDGDYDLFGFQSTLNFDSENLEFLGIESGTLNIDETNIGINNIIRGKLSASWNSARTERLNEGDILFSVFFKALDKGTLVDNIGLSSDITVSEVYDESMETHDISLKIRSASMDDVPVLMVHQNTPNPFSEETSIAFDINIPTDVTLKIYDVSGRILHQETKHFVKGNHAFVINSQDIETNGVMTYSIETPFGKVTKKMVLIK